MRAQEMALKGEQQMAKYIIKRLLVLIPILLGVALIIFTIMDLTPGDPAVRILGPESSIEAREQLREDLGLNQPFWVRFFDYIKNAYYDVDFNTGVFSVKEKRK